ncbi:MAG: response regulator [Janthinobacterium lividum]
MVARPLRVLLIEDSVLIRHGLSEAIDSGGTCRVANVADTAPQAIEHLRAERFDVVIVDLQLREGSGFDVLEFLQTREAFPAPFTMVLTNHTQAAFRRRCAACGVAHFFDKSLELERMLETLAAHALVVST